MSHLDDGQIAELIDGRADAAADEHVASCAACRDRVADARRVHDRARAILRSSVRSEAPPPFAEVLARAGAPRRRRRLPIRALAWAATVALAAGLGWYGRDMVLDPAPETSPAAPTAAVAAAEPTIDGPADHPALQPGAPTPTPVPTEADAIASAAGPAAPAGARDLDLGARVQAPPVAPAPAAAGRLELRQPARERAQADEIAMADEAPVNAWRSVTLEEAQVLLGGDVQRVEGLQTLGYAVRAVRGGVEVRTEQQLGRGSVLELLQRRADAAAFSAAGPAANNRPLVATDTVAPRRAEARRTVAPVEAVRRGDFIITGRAPISLDSLRALLLRLH